MHSNLLSQNGSEYTPHSSHLYKGLVVIWKRMFERTKVWQPSISRGLRHATQCIGNSFLVVAQRFKLIGYDFFA